MRFAFVGWDEAQHPHVAKESMFFSEEKKKKTFDFLQTAEKYGTSPASFWRLFYKKDVLPC
jgi:hypothetical protein